MPSRKEAVAPSLLFKNARRPYLDKVVFNPTFAQDLTSFQFK